MAVRPIRVFGDPVLRTPATEVVDYDKSLLRLVDDLADTCVDANGAGLAAPQVGVGLRVFVYVVTDPTDAERGTLSALVNPKLVERSAEDVEADEGCLSVPDLFYPLRRPREVVAEGFDVHGEPVSVRGTEMLARCLQHETDHLDGVLFLDRLEPDARKRALRELRERMLAGEDVRVKRSPHAGLA